MLRLLFRLVVLAVVVAIVVAVYVGYRATRGEPAPSGSTGIPETDYERARRTGAQIAGEVSGAATRAGKALSEGALTAKIRSKMELDDTIDASRVNVDTAGTVVTMRGSVRTKAQHTRVLQLARETAGVTAVVDEVVVTAR
jgi:hyperosmotically inducible protein